MEINFGIEDIARKDAKNAKNKNDQKKDTNFTN